MQVRLTSILRTAGDVLYVLAFIATLAATFAALATLTSCASGQPPPRIADPGACALATVAARNACPQGQKPTEDCVVASARVVEACRVEPPRVEPLAPAPGAALAPAAPLEAP